LRFGQSGEIPRHSQRQGYFRRTPLESDRVEETLAKPETSLKQVSVLRIAELSPSYFDWMHRFSALTALSAIFTAPPRARHHDTLEVDRAERPTLLSPVMRDFWSS
jgi:hypothetical protein